MGIEHRIREPDGRAVAARPLEAAGGSESESEAGSEAGGEAAARQRLVQDTATFTRQYSRWVDAQARSDGLRMPSLRVLERLHCQGPAMMRTLADELDLSPRNVTALVDALEADDLVVRRPHPTDRRATIVELTAAGLTAADALIAPRILAMGSLFDVLDADECQVFTRAIQRLRDAMADGAPPGTC